MRMCAKLTLARVTRVSETRRMCAKVMKKYSYVQRWVTASIRSRRCIAWGATAICGTFGVFAQSALSATGSSGSGIATGCAGDASAPRAIGVWTPIRGKGVGHAVASVLTRYVLERGLFSASDRSVMGC